MAKKNKQVFDKFKQNAQVQKAEVKEVSQKSKEHIGQLSKLVQMAQANLNSYLNGLADAMNLSKEYVFDSRSMGFVKRPK